MNQPEGLADAYDDSKLLTEAHASVVVAVLDRCASTTDATSAICARERKLKRIMICRRWELNMNMNHVAGARGLAVKEEKQPPETWVNKLSVK